MTKAEGIIFVDNGVLMTLSGGAEAFPKISAAMRKAIHTLGDIPMAVIVRDHPSIANDVRALTLQMNVKASVFAESDFEKTRFDSSLTHAFLAARQELGTKPQHTIAVIAEPLDVRQARNAGLAVLGYAEHHQADGTIAESMSRVGAFNTVFTPQDIPAAVDSFRPHREYQWVPMARNVKHP